MKKILSLVIALAFVFTAIACKNNSEEPAPVSPTLVATYELDPALLEEISGSMPFSDISIKLNFYDDNIVKMTQALVLTEEGAINDINLRVDLKIHGTVSSTYKGNPTKDGTVTIKTTKAVEGVEDFSELIPEKYAPIFVPSDDVTEEDIIELITKNGKKQKDDSYLLVIDADLNKAGKIVNLEEPEIAEAEIEDGHMNMDGMPLIRTYPALPHE